MLRRHRIELPLVVALVGVVALVVLLLVVVVRHHGPEAPQDSALPLK